MTPLDISSGVGYINPVINDYHVDLHGFRGTSFSESVTSGRQLREAQDAFFNV
jgi:hypothetical protein